MVKVDEFKPTLNPERRATMTKSKEHKTRLSAVEAVAGDRDRMKALMKEALQEVLEGEMSEFLGAAPGERTESRTGYRAAYYSGSLITQIGKLAMRVPRDRNGEFSTALFDRYTRSERALVGTRWPAQRVQTAVAIPALRMDRCCAHHAASASWRVPVAMQGFTIRVAGNTY
jgi:hypothetical protein